MWDCEVNQYFNFFTSTCQLCDPDCLHCATWGSCNECSSLNCTVCTELTGSCVENKTIDICLDEYYFTEGKCCKYPCSDCMGPLETDCLTCNEGFFLDQGSCNKCDSSCISCDGPSKDDCTCKEF